MSLVPISKNIMVRPENVGAIEQKFELGRTVLYVYVEGRSFQYDYEDVMPIDSFIELLCHDNTQIFAG